MTLTELLERQSYLQDKLPVRPTPDQLYMATVAEVGELVQELKASWCWWKRYDAAIKAVDQLAVLEELTDVMHFVLGHILCYPHLRTYNEITDNHYDSYWTNATGSVETSIKHILGDSPQGRLYGLVVLAVVLGFSREQLEEAYMSKSEKNLERWEPKQAPKQVELRGYQPQSTPNEGQNPPTSGSNVRRPKEKR